MIYAIGGKLISPQIAIKLVDNYYNSLLENAY